MKRRDCEFCRRHRARWIVEIEDRTSRTRRVVRVCGICKWRYWPSPRREKRLVIVKLISRVKSRRL